MHKSPPKPDRNNSNQVDTISDSSFIVGVIGCGSIGSKFIRNLIKLKIVSPSQIRVSSRTPSKAKLRCNLDVISSNTEIASQCTVLFLFILPFQFRQIYQEIRESIQINHPLIISTLSGTTKLYLQRSLNTSFVITTGIDISVIETSVEDEHNLLEFEETDFLHSGTYNNAKAMKLVDSASFAAENLVRCGFDFVNSIVYTLCEWASKDPNFERIKAKPETYERLWEKSFVSLSSILTEEKFDQIGKCEIKKAFIRALVRNETNERKELSSSSFPQL
ncbi:late competence protein ComER [Histomonas meleagridis]|uniref:late competence protein ComER n=1 Tax=Histomonas meleagridis TaxID=135588 RepID=UPI00355A81B9|nr:late competence protein ComER [Histomonas meleagridis]KAH0802733.1 late competence protein ComER [Histomonas meleagridis]